MNPIRFAVIGSHRGRSFINSAQALQGVELKAICDINSSALSEWSDRPRIKLYSDYDQVLADPEIDAVCIATPINLHASQSIAALNAGKHVLSEVTAFQKLHEASELIEAVRRTGLTYMMAENYCFMEPILQVQRMVEEGVFGKLTYASGSYLHDCCNLLFTEDGELTWRGNGRRTSIAGTYPTHSLGPISRWLGINRTDRLATMATWCNRPEAAAFYAEKNFPERTEYADPSFWSMPDSCVTNIQTANKTLITLLFDAVSPRPHQMARHELQGTKASFCWPDGPNAADSHNPEPLIWIDGRSPVVKGNPVWEPLSRYREEYQHPLWAEHGEQARKAGHGGGDYFVLGEFASAIRENRPPLFDVYDAVTWSSIAPLAIESVKLGSAPVTIPDFKLLCR